MKAVLSEQKCEACNAKATLASPEQVASLGRQIPEWDVVESDGVQKLRRIYSFKNFRQALDFTVRVGEMAEAEGHHPLCITEWGRVEISWWTHIIGGLHVNDFIAAAKCDALYGES